MNELSSYLRRTLCEAWQSGYGEEARRAAIVAPLLALVGFAAAWFFPQLTDHVMGVLEQAIDSAGLSSTAETKDMAAAIFPTTSPPHSRRSAGVVSPLPILRPSRSASTSS